MVLYGHANFSAQQTYGIVLCLVQHFLQTFQAEFLVLFVYRFGNTIGIVEDDINLAMNKYNTKKKKKKKKKPETTAAKSGGGENQTGQPGPGPECESGSCGIPQAEPAAAPAEMTEKADSDDK